MKESDLTVKSKDSGWSESTWCDEESFVTFALKCRFLGPAPEILNQNLREGRTGSLNF